MSKCARSPKCESEFEFDSPKRWGVIFTPTIVFIPEFAALSTGKPGHEIKVASMPGAFGGLTFKAMFEWVKAKGYEGNEHFQKYVIRKMNKRRTQ